MDADNIGLFAEAVYKKLDIKESTFRRWASELEKEGYTFQRNDREQRIYYQNDILIMEKLKQLIAEGVPKREALKLVVRMDLEGSSELAPSAHGSGVSSETAGIQRLPQEDIALIGDLIRQAVDQTKVNQEEMIKAAVNEAVEQNTKMLMDELDKKLKDMVENRDREVVTQMQQNYDEKHKEERSFIKRLFRIK